MEYLAELFVVHSDVSLTPLLINDLFTKSQQFVLDLHAYKVCAILKN